MPMHGAARLYGFMRISTVHAVETRLTCAATRFGEAGFTLIELLVTALIVSILASMALPLAELTAKRSREQDLRTALREIRQAIDAYKQAADAGYVSKSMDESGYPPSLQSLVEGVRDLRDPQGGKLFFLRRVPRDPMSDRERSITAAETWGLRSYASEAHNPRAGTDVYDVYSKSNEVGLNGIPYREW